MSRGEKNPFQLTKNDILDAFSSYFNKSSHENLQSNLNLRNTSSSGLAALQSYGQVIQSPGWNAEPSLITSEAASCKPFSNLNLNSVEEEDEYLYGDSNSVPEAHTSIKEDPVTNSTGRPDTEWSDDEDPYGGNTSKLNFRLKKNISDCDYQNKTHETVKLYHTERQEDCIEDSSSTKISEQKYFLQKLEPDVSVLSPKTETNQFVSETSSNKAKSKYHVAAEILKKRTVEKTNLINSSSNERLGSFLETSKNISELEYKAVHTDLKTDKPDTKLPRRAQNTIFKKHLDNIKDYITGPQRKRNHPREEFGPEKYTRGFSPSRHLSPHKSSLPNYKHRSSQLSSESDNIKYASSYSRHRSPSFEYDKRPARYSESRRQYSPSPKRWSREISPDYRRRDRSRRSRDRSPRSRRSRSRSRRSRSRSPGYHSSKSKTYDKKKVDKSANRSRKKEKNNYSSGDSFCSLSLGSSSDSSSSSSDESSGEKKKSKKQPVKTALKGNKKHENEIVNFKGSDERYSTKSDNTSLSDDISKKLSDIFNVKNSNVSSDLLNAANIHDLVNALQPPDTSQHLIEFLEGFQRHQQQLIATSQSSTVTSPAVSNINIASNLQMPVIPSSESYAYSTMSGAPVQYVAPQILNFPQMISSAAYPAPVMSSTPPTQYGPYLPVVPPAPSTDSQYITSVVPKSGKVRHSTLRTIPMSDSLNAPSASSSNITIVPNNCSQLKSAKSSLELTKPKAEESKLSLKSSKPSSEKGDKKSIDSSSKLIAESTSEQNKLLIIEKFKKLKTERAKALCKSKSASADLDEMRKILDETFGKKISVSDKLIYTKCKTWFNIGLDSASNFNKEARRLDEELNKFKSKLPTSLQAEVSKIKLEQCKDELVTDEVYTCLDQGDHHCFDCYVQFVNVKEFLNHIQTPEHKEFMETNNNDWKKDFIKEEKEETGLQKKSVFKPVKGVEFVKPITGFYCALCKEVILQESTTEAHVKSHKHCLNYMNFLRKNPLYEKKYLFKRYIKHSLNQKRSNDIKEIKRKQAKEAAEKKSKEILQNEKSKEVKFEDLVEEDYEDYPPIKPSPPSCNQKASNIKLNLSEKDKDKSAEKQKSSKELETKNSTKYIYIGKAPNFKKTQSQKPTSWYERENLSNKKESDARTSSSNVEKAAKICHSPKLKQSSSIKKSEMSNKLQKMLQDIEEKNQLQAEQKKNQEAAERWSKVIILDENTKSSDSSLSLSDKTTKFESKDPVIKQVKKSNLNVSRKDIPLSEITLPEEIMLPNASDSNTPQPMDIDNSQDVQGKSKTEEEKDFLLLGINKEDFQPLVVPVPPPTSMVSYPTLYNVQPLSSNVSCSTTSTSSMDHAIKTLDFSVPPPTIPPYQNSVPHMPVYNNQNNTQSVGSYSYPTNNPQMSLYSNPSLQTDYQSMSPFSTPPPTFRNPPPMLPYSNTSNMPSVPHFSGTNNLSYNTSFSNSIPLNPNTTDYNQSYQPSVYSAPPNNQNLYPVVNTSQNLVPPGSACDTSFINNNNNNNSSFNAFIPTSTYVHQSKTSPTLKKVKGNLITIVPEKTRFQTNESVTDSKPIKFKETTSKMNVKYNCEFPTNDDLDKDINKDVGKHQSKKTSNAISINKEKLKTSKIVRVIEASSYDTSDSSKKMNESCLENEVKHIIDECVEKIQLKELKNYDSKESVKSSLIVQMPVTLNNTTNSNYELIKSEKMPVLEISNIKMENENKNDSEETTLKPCEKQIPALSMEIDDIIVIEKSSNDISSLADNSNKIDKVFEGAMQDNETVQNESTEIVTIDSVPSKQEQISTNHASKISLHETCKAEHEKTCDKLIEVCDDAISEKSFIECCSPPKKSSDKIEKSEGVENPNVISNIEEKNIGDSCIHENVLKENIKSCAIPTVEVLKQKEKSSDSVGLVPMPIDDSVNSNYHEVSDSKIENKANENDTEEKLIKICEKQILAQSVEIDDSTDLKKSSNNICSLADNSNKIDEITEDRESVEVTMMVKANEKLASSILDSETIQKQSTENVTNDYVDSNYHELSDIKIENKNNENDSEETIIKICEKQIHAQSVEIDDSTDVEKSSNNICSLADNSNEITEDRESMEVTMMVNANEKLASSILDSETIQKQSTEYVINDSVLSKQEQINPNNAREFSFDETCKANQKEDYDTLSEVGDNIVSEKSFICCISGENSSEKIEKGNDLEMSNANAIVEKENVQNECIKSYGELSIDTDKVIEQNEESLQTIDMMPMSGNEAVDSNSHNDENLMDAPIDDDEISEIKVSMNEKTSCGRKLRKRRKEVNWGVKKRRKRPVGNKVLKSSGPDLEGDNSVVVESAFNDHSSSSSKVIEKETSVKSVAIDMISEVSSKEEIEDILLHDKNVLDTESKELSLSSNPDPDKGNQTCVEKKEESENVSIPMEDSENSACDKLQCDNESEDHSVHLKLHDGCETSRIECKSETEEPIQSDYQESTEENKTEAPAESVIEVKEKTDRMETSNIPCSETEGKEETAMKETSKTPCLGSKNSSDTEEYEEEQ